MGVVTGRVMDEARADDATALREARSGNPAAFEAIAAGRLDGAFRFASAILGSGADATDATRNAFVAAWRELPRLRDLDQFDAWLDRILLNECRMRLRAATVQVGRDRRRGDRPVGPRPDRGRRPP